MGKKIRYSSIKKLGATDAPEFAADELVVAQEKLDGSNVTIEFTRKNGTQFDLRMFSSTKEITNEVKGTFVPFIEWANKTFRDAEDADLFGLGMLNMYNTDVFRIHGEWLMMAKLPYNKTHEHTFWLFDISKGEGEEKEYLSLDFVKGFWKSLLNTKNIGHQFGDKGYNFNAVKGFNLIPQVAEGKYADIIAKMKDLVIDQKTTIQESNSAREGIVLKSIDGKKRLKFVAPAFKESMGERKPKGIPMFQFNVDLIDANRIQKYIYRLKEEGILPTYVDFEDGQTKGKIFKNSPLLHQDFLDEELPSIMKMITKLLKQQTGKAIKKYIADQVALQYENIK